MVLAGALASEGVYECVCVKRAATISRDFTKKNVPTCECDHSPIEGHQRLCVPPLECSVYGKVRNYGVVTWL